MAVMSGAFVQGGATKVAAFEAWRRKPLDCVHDFAPGGTWSAIELPDWWLNSWGKSSYSKKMVVSLPILPKDGGGTLRNGAAGAYDAHFYKCGSRLVAHGLSGATLRLGWEMNGSWASWTARNDPKSWLAYLRRIVAALRSVSNQQFKIVFCPAAGWSGFDPLLVWDASVFDIVGVDTYDKWWNHQAATATSRWAAITKVVQHGGLDFWPTFCRGVGKPLAICEWGLWSEGTQQGGGGDDPYYIDQMRAWLDRNADVMAFECYQDADALDGSHRLESGQFPQASREYQLKLGALQ